MKPINTTFFGKKKTIEAYLGTGYNIVKNVIKYLFS